MNHSYIPEINLQEIHTLLPHRDPFLFLDKLVDIHLGEKATGVKFLTGNESFFQGHFPENPIMPGVLVIEALAQAAGALVVKTLRETSGDQRQKSVYFMSVEETKFRKPIFPKDYLELRVNLLRNRGSVWKFTGKAFCKEQLMAESVFTAMIADQSS